MTPPDETTTTQHTDLPAATSADGATSADAVDREFATFEQFYPYYVAMHSKPSTRWIHLVGTLTGLAVATAGALSGRWALLAALPVLGYSAAWPAHWFVEGNNPATFGHPAWSLRGDATMIGTMLTGRDGELTRIAETWLAAHPEQDHRRS